MDIKSVVNKTWLDKMSTMKVFKERLKEMVSRAKTERGLTQRDLAKNMNVSHERFNKWLTTLNEPRLAHLCTLARVLNTHVGYLLGEDDNPIPIKDRKIESKLDEILKNVKG